MTLALTTGALALAAGLARLGFAANFIYEPVVKGFIVGLALTIIARQLPKLVGVEKVRGLLPAAVGISLTRLGQTSWLTLLAPATPARPSRRRPLPERMMRRPALGGLINEYARSA